MGGSLNWEKYADVGQDKTHKEPTCKHDAEHGYYEESKDGKPTESKSKSEPNKKTPFVLTK